MNPFTITQTIKKIPHFPYETIKNDILGKRYILTLNFIGPTRAQKLNEQSRQKTYVPNVLSFPLDENCGEIFICPQITKREAHRYHLSNDGYVAFLFIHGLLHLKGHDHSDTMDKLEQRYLRKYNIS